MAAIGLLAVCQALDLRGDEFGSRRARALWNSVREEIPMVTEDRRQDHDIAKVLELLRERALPIGEIATDYGGDTRAD